MIRDARAEKRRALPRRREAGHGNAARRQREVLLGKGKEWKRAAMAKRSGARLSMVLQGKSVAKISNGNEGLSIAKS